MSSHSALSGPFASRPHASRILNTASEVFCSAARLLRVVPQRDLAGLQADVRQYRSIVERAEEDMTYAKSINAELWATNTALAERNICLERRNLHLEVENRDMKACMQYLQAENMQLKEHNQSLFFSANAIRKAKEFRPVAFGRGGQVRA